MQLVPVGIKEEEQHNHDYDYPQKLFVISIKKAVEQTHNGVLLSLLATAYART